MKHMDMKKILLLLGITIVCTNSCNKLDLEPLDRINADAYYKTSADFDAAILASYSSIQDFWGTSSETFGESGEYWKLTLATTDDVAADANNGGPVSLDNLNFFPTDIAFASLYSQIYEGIMRANLVLHHLDGDNDLSDEEKQQYTGEARFLRAFFHFEALKMWGTPPLVTTAVTVFSDVSSLKKPNATREELFDQILEDFQIAHENLPDAWDAGNTGRVTSWAARAFEGKVNVWKEDWDAAIDAFEDVLTNSPYRLIDTDNPEKDLEDIFAFDNENNPESIFEVQFAGPFADDNLWVFDDTHTEAVKASQGIARTLYWDAANGAPGGKSGWYVPTQDLVDAFEPDDARLHAFIYAEGDEYYTTSDNLEPVEFDPAWSPTGYIIKKYRGRRNSVSGNYAANLQVDFNNERIFRVAELKLLYAEALIERGREPEAAQQINDIRNRAGLPDLDVAADLTEALRHEKRIELAFEPHRWFDIVRWEIGSEIFPAEWDDKLSLFPFPQIEVDRVGKDVLEQNNGY
jgi:starch-binding outer membrane protein, SusD/RagB family